MSEPSKLLELLNLPDKRSVEKFCRDLVVTKTELSNLFLAARLGDLPPYLHAVHHAQFVPEHLLPTDADNGAIFEETTDPRGNKFVRKVSQIFPQRRLWSFHRLFTPAKDQWHLIYFNQRDMCGTENHWTGGAHFHYSRNGFVNDTFDTMWARLLGDPPKPPAHVHIRFADPRERGFVGPRDTA